MMMMMMMDERMTSSSVFRRRRRGLDVCPLGTASEARSWPSQRDGNAVSRFFVYVNLSTALRLTADVAPLKQLLTSRLFAPLSDFCFGRHRRCCCREAVATISPLRSKGKGKGAYTWCSHTWALLRWWFTLRSESPPQKRPGMARVLKGFRSFTCTPARSSAIGMNHTCLCLPFLPTDPGGMEGWVDLGAK